MTRDFAKSTESFLNAMFKDTKRKASASVQQHRAPNGIVHYVTVAENGLLRILSTPDDVAAFLAGKSASTTAANGTASTTATSIKREQQ